MDYFQIQINMLLFADLFNMSFPIFINFRFLNYNMVQNRKRETINDESETNLDMKMI